MSFDELEAKLGLLLTMMQNEPQDRHELYLQIRESMGELRAYGLPVPKDLIDFESALEGEFSTNQASDTPSEIVTKPAD
ncbi:MAG: hypothetical protein ABL894_08580 [Hyphomicrobium sp.]